ncbi:MAG: hypothetical protein RIB59_04355 [Rhodospirillales bacterium]
MTWNGNERRSADDGVRRIAEIAGREAGREAVKETFANIGLDVTSPAAKQEAQADFHYLRMQRLGAEHIKSTIRTTGIRTAVGALVLGLLTTLWMILKEHIK